MDPENFGLMSRHNSLDSMRRHSYQRLNSQPPQSPSPQSPVKKPQSPLPPQTQSTTYHNQSHTLPSSISYDDRLSTYPKTRQQIDNEQLNSTRLRHQSSFNSQFKHGNGVETINPVYQNQFSSLHRQVQRVRSGSDSRSLDRLDCDERDYPVFEDYPSSLRGGNNVNTLPRDGVNGVTVTYLPPPGKPRLKHSKSGDVSSRMNSLPRPSTLNVQNHDHLQQRSDNLQRHGSVSGLSNGSSKPVSIVHPQLWLETSLDDVGATAGVQSPKSRSKNWTETSLDSPLPIRRSKSKEMGSTSTLASMTANLDNLITGRSVTPTSSHSMSHPASNAIQSSSIPEESKETTPTSICSPTSTNGRTSVIPEFNYQTGVPTVDVVSVGQFQPYWEETKPYELSDFYKYSTKHRNSSASSSNQNSPVKCNKKDDSSLQDVSNSPCKELNGATATRTQRDLYYGNSGPAATYLPESPINKYLLSPTRVVRRANSPA